MLKLTPAAPPANSWLYNVVTGANLSPDPDLTRQEVHGQAWELVELHVDELEAALASGEIRDAIRAATDINISVAGICYRRAQRYITEHVSDMDEQQVLQLLLSYDVRTPLRLSDLQAIRARAVDCFVALVMAELKAREAAGDLSLRLNPEKGDST
jgi:hypothetical protein